MSRNRVAAALTAGALSLTIQPAMAQSFWDGPVKKNSVYDKRMVRFPASYRPGQIIVSFSDRRLYHVVRRGRAVSYPIAVPRRQSRWNGVLRVSMKRVNPPWTPTAKMRRENPNLPRTVPGGHPRNPMGARALYLGSTLYRIHGTDAPWTIGKNVSKGCVRMHNAHVEDLYRRVGVGTRVTATWKRFRT
ncbi:MAG: L,D-transpeptidase, partial [Pseudomonadota bacterium]